MLLGVITATALCVCVLVANGRGEPIYRLPKTVLPSQYVLSLETDRFGFNFSGKVTIDVDVKTDTNNITLHSKHLTIHWVKLSEAKGINEIPSNFSLDSTRDVILIQSDRILQNGSQYNIRIAFEGYLTTPQNQLLSGYFRVPTGPTESEWMSSTAFEMVAARRAFPCWDEPQFKARFTINLIHHTSHKALSNMPRVNSRPAEKEGWVIDHFQNSPLMSSYLVTFQLLQWDFIETEAGDGRLLRLWASRKDLPSAQNHLAFARKALAWFENYTGFREPMPKIDLVAVPEFHGAIENWGDISFRPIDLMHKQPGEPLDLEMSTIAHELAHSWFGNLVTPLWWDSLWLSEGAATFFSALAVEEIIPGHCHLRSKALKYQTYTYYTNLRETNYPLSKSYNYMEDLLEMPRNVYYHGFSLFYMLFQSLGPAHFQAGVHQYISGMQYNNTTPRKFFDALDYHWEGKDLHELMDEWTYRGGFPVVTVTRSKGQLTLKQERYIFNVSEDRSRIEEEHLKWWVPISFTTQSKKDFHETKPKLWFKDTKTITDPAEGNEWIMLNNMASGLYIVEYDKSTLDMIKKSLSTPNYDGIPETMREKLLFDFELLVLKGGIELNEIWEMHELLTYEKAKGPWTIALAFTRIVQEILDDTPVADMLRGQMQRLVRKRKVQARHNDLLQSRIGQSACFFDLPECITTYSKLFHQWTIQSHPDEVNPIPSDLKPVVYCSAMHSHNPEYWNFLLERAIHAETSVHRDIMFTGLGCTHNYSHLYKLLDSQKTATRMTERDWNQLLEGLVRHNNDVGPALRFIKTALHALQYEMKIGIRLDSNVLGDLAEQIVEPAQLKQFMDIINHTKDTKGLTKLTRMVRHQIQWKKRNSYVMFM